MYPPRDLWRLLFLAVLFGVFACSNPPTAPQQVIETGEPPAFFVTAPSPGIVALRSYHPLKKPMSVSKRIGPRGGVIEIDKLDVGIYFPRGALSEGTRITVKALAGSVVGFEFAPHGLTFDVPVEIRIDEDSPLLADFDSDDFDDLDDDDDVDRSAYTRSGLLGVYFLGDPAAGVVPRETLPIYVDDDDLVLEISHFSGYALSEPSEGRKKGYAVASGLVDDGG